MSIEQRIDDFIEAGLRPLGVGFGPVALQHWRRKVFDYVTAVYGRITFAPDISKIVFAKREKGKGK